MTAGSNRYEKRENGKVAAAQATSCGRRAAKGAIELRRARYLLVGLVVLAALLVAGATPLAEAAAIAVNTTDDELNTDGDCSLREAIRAANTDAAVDTCSAGSGADTITVPAGTYALSIAGTGENAAATGDLGIACVLETLPIARGAAKNCA